MSGSFRLLPTKFQKRVKTTLHVHLLVLQNSDPLSGVIRLSVQLFQFYIRRILIPPDLSFGQVSETTGLVKDDDAQSASVLHSGLQNGIPFFLARVVTNDPAAKRSTLVRVEVMAR